MNRFEDQFKDAFEHFEPEVDPKLWQQISQQLPAVPQADPGSFAGLKNLLAKLGLKGGISLLALAGITLTAILYFTNNNSESVNSNSAVENALPQAPLASENVSINVNDITANPEGLEIKNYEFNHSINENAAAGTKKNPAVASDNLTQVALTGDVAVGKGEPSSRVGSPSAESSVPAVKAIESTSSDTPPVKENTINQQVAPILIVSGKGGFAPFTVTALTNKPGQTAEYDFGDGSHVMKAASAHHTYTEPGIYTIQCELDGHTLEQKIEVIGKIPSAFSPNGDGINDSFTINDIEGFSVELRIYNRTGKLMYNSKGYAIAWDGKTPDGQEAEAGTYLYDIFATSDGGCSYKQKGTIHLFR